MKSFLRRFGSQAKWVAVLSAAWGSWRFWAVPQIEIAVFRRLVAERAALDVMDPPGPNRGIVYRVHLSSPSGPSNKVAAVLLRDGIAVERSNEEPYWRFEYVTIVGPGMARAGIIFLSGPKGGEGWTFTLHWQWGTWVVDTAVMDFIA